jgi:hypothetical protein
MNRIIIIAFVFALLNSCNPCRNLDCISSNYTLRFRLLDRNTEYDLFFGQQSIYDPNETVFYTLNGSDTTIYDYNFTTYGTDSIISVDFFPQSNEIYMEFDNGDIDTFYVNYDTESTECCGVVTTVSKIIYQSQEFSVDNLPKILKK